MSSFDPKLSLGCMMTASLIMYCISLRNTQVGVINNVERSYRMALEETHNLLTLRPHGPWVYLHACCNGADHMWLSHARNAHSLIGLMVNGYLTLSL